MKEKRKMIKETIMITDGEGLHLRPAGLLSKLTRKFSCETTIIFKGAEINAKKMMAILSAAITPNSQIDFVCDGEDETDAMAEVKAFFEGGMA